MPEIRYRRHWRFYRTVADKSPVDDDLDLIAKRSQIDAAAIVAAMKEIAALGRACTDVNRLRRDIWQIEIDGDRVIYRLLFAEEGHYGEVLLGLLLLNKKT